MYPEGKIIIQIREVLHCIKPFCCHVHGQERRISVKIGGECDLWESIAVGGVISSALVGVKCPCRPVQNGQRWNDETSIGDDVLIATILDGFIIHGGTTGLQLSR